MAVREPKFFVFFKIDLTIFKTLYCINLFVLFLL